MIKLFLPLSKLALLKACWAKPASRCISLEEVQRTKIVVVLEDFYLPLSWPSLWSTGYGMSADIQKKGSKGTLIRGDPAYAPTMSCFHSWLHKSTFYKMWLCIITSLKIKASSVRRPRKTFRGLLFLKLSSLLLINHKPTFMKLSRSPPLKTFGLKNDKLFEG